MSRADACIIALCGLAVGASYGLLWQGDGHAGIATVWADGTEVARLPLDEQRLFEVDGPVGTSIVEVRPGRARVRASPGRQQICVRQGWLSRAGETAVCLPNRVVVAIEGAEREFDAIGF